MSPGERQREIIRILLSRRFETMKNLAREIGASERTIRRDVMELTADYPLITVPGRYGGVKLADDYHPFMNSLSREEEELLKLAATTFDEERAAGFLGMLVKYGRKPA